MRLPRFLPPALALLVAGCATAPQPAPRQHVAPPPPAAPPPPTDWRDLAETKGGWRYVAEPAATTARFEADGALRFALRCDKATRRITLLRPATKPPITVTTSYGARTLSTPDLAATDPLLDQIAFSRGRFTIETPGSSELVLPAWAEPARVIEDCRS